MARRLGLHLKKGQAQRPSHKWYSQGMRIYDRYVKALMLDHYEIQHDRVVGLVSSSRLCVPIKPANAFYNTPVPSPEAT